MNRRRASRVLALGSLVVAGRVWAVAPAPESVNAVEPAVPKSVAFASRASTAWVTRVRFRCSS